MFTEKEKNLLISLICFEQIAMIKHDRNNYETDEYKELEELKVKINNQ